MSFNLLNYDKDKNNIHLRPNEFFWVSTDDIAVYHVPNPDGSLYLAVYRNGDELAPSFIRLKAKLVGSNIIITVEPNK